MRRRRFAPVAAATLFVTLAGCGSSDPPDTPTAAERRWLGPVAISEPAQEPTLATNARGDVRVAWSVYGVGGGIRSSALASGQWSTAEAVASGSADRDPQLAIDESGAALAIWREEEPFPYGWLKAARRASGSGWDAPVTLNDGRSSDFFAPQLRVFDDGGALVVWIEGDALCARHLEPKSGWGSPIVLGDAVASAGQFPVLWTDAAGSGFVLWLSRGGWSARHLDPRSGWGAEELLPDVGSRFEEPSIAVTSGGAIDVVWERYESGSSPFVFTSVWANWFVPGSGWTRVAPLAADARLSCGTAIDSLGQLAVWGCRVDSNGPGWGTWYARRTAGGGWGGARRLTSLPSEAAWRMLASYGGNSVALWSRGVSTSPGGLWAARFTAGSEWESPQVVVQSGSVVDPLYLRMTSASDGVVVWIDGAFGSDSQQIRSAQFADGGWRPAQDVSGVANLSGIPYPFHMVVRPSGDAVAVWSQSTSGSPSSVWSNTFVTR